MEGVAVRSGVALTAGAQRFVRNLRAAVPRSIVPTITVTSGSRTIPEQAAAMLKKYLAGGAAELREVYGKNNSTITKLLAAPKNAASWAAILAAEIASGKRISRHVVGNTSPGAIDLHTATLTSRQVDALKVAVESLGGRALIEDAPPHMHVDLPAVDAALDVVENVARGNMQAARKAFPWAAGGGLLVALVLIGIGRRRRTKEAT